VPKLIKLIAIGCIILIVIVMGTVHHTEMQYCADCGATGVLSQWRVYSVPVWTTRSPGRTNALSEYMQQHGWPREHSDWRYVDALDSNPILGITGWYAGNHFRSISVRDIDPIRLQNATAQFSDLPLVIDRLILKVPDNLSGFSERDELAQLYLSQFIDGRVEWEEMEEKGIVKHFRAMVGDEE
jgi:hypothetical protein